MSDPAQSYPLLKIGIATIGILAGLAAIVFLSDWVDGDSGSSEGSGVLTIGEATYTFTPITCFVSEEDFVAAGTGVDGSEQFWVSASSINLDLIFGTDNEVDQPADDQLWLASENVINWNATGQTVVARAPMSDRRTPDSTEVVGSLEVRCGNDA